MYKEFCPADAIQIGVLNIPAFMLKQGLNRKAALHAGKAYIIEHCLKRTVDWSYNAEGSPVLHHKQAYMSVSHTSNILCVAINHRGRIGIDIEIPHTRLQTVRSKFLNEKEAQDAGDSLLNLCAYWCAKEALFKYHGKKGYFLKYDFSVWGAWPAFKGQIPETNTHITLRGFMFEDHCCVFAYEKSR
jgi:4'-phosphopantetheinyl transferase EntD